MQLRGKVFLIFSIAISALLSYNIGFMRGSASNSLNLADAKTPRFNSETSGASIPNSDRVPTFFETVVNIKTDDTKPEDTTIDVSLEQSESIEEQASRLSTRLHVVPDAVITSYLNDYLGADTVSKLENPREFAENIIEVIASEDDSEPLQGDIQSYVSLSPASGLRLINSSVGINQFASVYAHFAHFGSQATADIDLLLKWKNLSSGQTVQIGHTTVSSSQSTNFYPYRPEQGWEPGNYQMLAYELYGNNELLSSVQFQIDEIYTQNPNETRLVNHEAINEMTSVGQAVRKNISQQTN